MLKFIENVEVSVPILQHFIQLICLWEFSEHFWFNDWQNFEISFKVEIIQYKNILTILILSLVLCLLDLSIETPNRTCTYLVVLFFWIYFNGGNSLKFVGFFYYLWQGLRFSLFIDNVLFSWSLIDIWNFYFHLTFRWFYSEYPVKSIGFKKILCLKIADRFYDSTYMKCSHKENL
jgi:hypothetical protein